MSRAHKTGTNKPFKQKPPTKYQQSKQTNYTKQTKKTIPQIKIPPFKKKRPKIPKIPPSKKKKLPPKNKKLSPKIQKKNQQKTLPKQKSTSFSQPPPIEAPSRAARHLRRRKIRVAKTLAVWSRATKPPPSRRVGWGFGEGLGGFS